MGKERLEEELVSRGLAVPGPELDMLMELFDTYSTQARIDELRKLDMQAVWNDSRLNGYLERRFIELAPSTTKHNTSKE